MNIIIGADFVPTSTNEQLFSRADGSTLLGADLLSLINEADYRIFNLETPLVDAETPIPKCGPCFRAPRTTVELFKSIKVNLFTLANNHLMDQGEQGFSSTTNTLDAANISYVGAGQNLSEAIKPHIFDVGDKKIGVYACAENEFSIAGINTAGANPFDALYSFDHVKELKSKTDLVIVLYHGGKEHYRYPSPELQRYCRKFIEVGADYVLCQHSHCIGCKEEYQSGTIIYGQGNFLFDSPNNNSVYRQTSLLLRIHDSGIDYIPIVKNSSCVRLASEEQSSEILDLFISRSKEILDPNVIDQKYSEFAMETYQKFMWQFFSGNRFVFRFLNRITNFSFSKWYVNRKMTTKATLQLLNKFKCEAHRELFIQALDDLVSKIKSD